MTVPWQASIRISVQANAFWDSSPKSSLLLIFFVFLRGFLRWETRCSFSSQQNGSGLATHAIQLEFSELTALPKDWKQRARRAAWKWKKCTWKRHVMTDWTNPLDKDKTQWYTSLVSSCGTSRSHTVLLVASSGQLAAHGCMWLLDADKLVCCDQPDNWPWSTTANPECWSYCQYKCGCRVFR